MCSKDGYLIIRWMGTSDAALDASDPLFGP